MPRRGRAIKAIRLDVEKFDAVEDDVEAVPADREVRPVAQEVAVRLPGMAGHSNAIPRMAISAAESVRW